MGDGLSHGKTLSDFPKALSILRKKLSVFSSLQLSIHWIQLSCEQEQLLADGSRCGDEVEAKWNVRARRACPQSACPSVSPLYPWNVMAVILFLRREGGKGGAFLRKTVFKNYPSPSPLAKKVPVNRGLRAVLAGAKGSRRFTSLSQIWCETFVKRQKQEKGMESPVDRGL